MAKIRALDVRVAIAKRKLKRLELKQKIKKLQEQQKTLKER